MIFGSPHKFSGHQSVVSSSRNAMRLRTQTTSFAAGSTLKQGSIVTASGMPQAGVPPETARTDLVEEVLTRSSPSHVPTQRFLADREQKTKLGDSYLPVLRAFYRVERTPVKSKREQVFDFKQQQLKDKE